MMMISCFLCLSSRSLSTSSSLANRIAPNALTLHLSLQFFGHIDRDQGYHLTLWLRILTVSRGATRGQCGRYTYTDTGYWYFLILPSNETLQGVLGSGENGLIRTGSRSMGPKRLGSKARGAKESNLRCREQKILGIVSKNLIRFSGFFFASLRLANFSTSILHFHQM